MMQNRTQTRATALKRTDESGRFMYVLAGGLVGLAALFGAQAANAESHDTVIQSHGYNEYGDLKYAADFAHLDYVNPDAPIGGEVSISASGTFDNMNPFATLSGSPGAMASVMYERIMTGTDDEVGSNYCLLCTTLQYPEDESWVIFNMREDVTFSDGTPMTAHDVVYTHELLREQSTPSYRAGIVSLVETYEAIDDYTVKFTFSEDAPERGRVSQMAAQIVMYKAWFE
jgi:microcin C transport system substrate-binding protein